MNNNGGSVDIGFVGVLFTLVVVIGGIIARDRYIQKTISDGDKSLHETIDQKVNVLHERVNKTRDEFVRRDDLDKHMERMEKTLSSVYSEIKGVNTRIDEFMVVTVRDGKRGS